MISHFYLQAIAESFSCGHTQCKAVNDISGHNRNAITYPCLFSVESITSNDALKRLTFPSRPQPYLPCSSLSSSTETSSKGLSSQFSFVYFLIDLQESTDSTTSTTASATAEPARPKKFVRFSFTVDSCTQTDIDELVGYCL